MPPDPPSMGRLRDNHMGFLHKLGNPLPQILDPPLEMQINLLSEQKFQIEMQNDLQIDLQNEWIAERFIQSTWFADRFAERLLCLSDFYFWH